MVASEKHQDGTDHLHAFIKYEKKTEWAPRKWDLDGFHGNYQKARSWQDVKAYCMKGGNFISSFDVDAATRKKSCGRAFEQETSLKRISLIFTRGSSPASGLLENKGCEGGLY